MLGDRLFLKLHASRSLQAVFYSLFHGLVKELTWFLTWTSLSIILELESTENAES